ncbi:unnamed protein product, partial [Amoebophrya sp. A25]
QRHINYTGGGGGLLLGQYARSLLSNNIKASSPSTGGAYLDTQSGMSTSNFFSRAGLLTAE